MDHIHSALTSHYDELATFPSADSDDLADAADAGPPGTAHAGLSPELARPDVGAARSGGSIQTVAAGLRVIGNAVAVVILCAFLPSSTYAAALMPEVMFYAAAIVAVLAIAGANGIAGAPRPP